MTLASKDMERLWKDSSPLHGRNHKGWLGEALNAVRSTANASAAAELLRQRRRDVGSEPERKAIDDVIGWLERRVRSEPRLAIPRLLLELGWLRRMAVVRAETHTKDAHGGQSGHAGDRPRPTSNHAHKRR